MAGLMGINVGLIATVYPSKLHLMEKCCTAAGTVTPAEPQWAWTSRVSPKEVDGDEERGSQPRGSLHSDRRQNIPAKENMEN